MSNDPVNPPVNRLAGLLSMLNPDQIKRAARFALRSMGEPCGNVGCKATSPGPACSNCNTPLCLDHVYFCGSAPTRPMCPTCITGEHLTLLAQHGVLDEGDEDLEEPTPPRKKRSSKKPPAK